LQVKIAFLKLKYMAKGLNHFSLDSMGVSSVKSIFSLGKTIQSMWEHTLEKNLSNAW